MTGGLRGLVAGLPWLLGAGLLACDSDDLEPQTQAVPRVVRTDAVELAKFRPRTEITGSAEPVASVKLGFELGGRLQEVAVRRGDEVSKGQRLARLDTAVSAAQHNQAKAALAAARAKEAAARDAVERLEQMSDTVSAQQLAQMKLELEAAVARVAQASAAVDMSGASLDKHWLRSPISGVVMDAPDNPGTMVAAGTPLFLIENISALRVRGTAPETDHWLAPSQPALIRAGTGGDQVTGVVELVLPALDPATRRIPVEVRVDEPPAWLRAHAFVRAEVSALEEIDVFAVPRRALVARPEFAVLVMSGEGGAPERVGVTVLDDRSELVRVLGDLEEGDEVALDPPQDFGS